MPDALNTTPNTATPGATPDLTPAKKAEAAWLIRLRSGLALALVLVFAFYGFLAVEESFKSWHFMSGDHHAGMVALRDRTDAGVDVRGSPEVDALAMPIWMKLMADRTDSAYSYGSDSLFETAIYYTQMPALNKVTLSFHMLLGGICMLLGGSQFWPGFRRRYPKLHRVAGMVFVVTAQAAMVLSIIYLVRTPVAETYGDLVFHVGLWFLAIGVTLALGMAMYHVWKRQIGQHQAWMGIAYGFLLTAPLLRYDWILLGMMFPDASMNEANYAGMMLLIPQSFLFGYILVCLNRWLSRERATLQPLPWADAVRAALPDWLPVVGAVFVAFAVLTLHYYLVTPGLAGSELARQLIPASVVANEARVFAETSVATTTFGLLAAATLVLAPLFLFSAFTHDQSTTVFTRELHWLGLAVAVASGIVALLALHFGYALGAPSHATLSGGTFYLLMGGTGLAFALLLAQAVLRRRLALVKEWGLFALLAVAMAPLFHALVPVLGLFDIAPQYIASGHVYLLAAGIAPAGLLVGFLYAIYGSATRERVAY
ncbi:MAG: hypothetical protein K0R03_2686 [Moraxellaceae bacterium]|nr:hypothetical protein [Moraxellaceae bacterium]